jgi:hypothetical protein
LLRATLRKFWRRLPAILHTRELIAMEERDWGLWLRMLCVYRPIAYLYLVEFAALVWLLRLGIPTKPRRPVERIQAILRAIKGGYLNRL